MQHLIIRVKKEFLHNTGVKIYKFRVKDDIRFIKPNGNAYSKEGSLLALLPFKPKEGKKIIYLESKDSESLFNDLKKRSETILINTNKQTNIMTRLRKILDDKRISQKDLSKKTDIGEYKISRLCNGKDKNIQLQTALKITKVLECTLDDAFGDIDLQEE